MSDKKLFSAREAAQAVLNKAKALLEDSSLMKAEKLKKDGSPSPSPSPNSAATGIMAGFNSMGMGGGGAGSTSMPKSEMKKYETENNPKPGVKYGKIEKDQKALERDYPEYEVKKPSFKDSTGPRLERQISPSGNPAEEAEGNNKPDGMEPEYEFKDKVSKELAKEKASHMVKSQSGMHTVVYQSMEKSEKLEKGDWKKIHDKLKREGYSEESANKIDGSIKAKLGKGENPDEKADAELGEQVEKDVEQHFKENKEAEAQEGHELMAKPGDKVEGQSEQASIPRLILSAKLSKFMEYRHAKKKAAQGAQSQAAAAVGHEASNAPQAGSGQAGQPDNCRPKTQPTKGDSDKV
jgi:hypothetical protein